MDGSYNTKTGQVGLNKEIHVFGTYLNTAICITKHLYISKLKFFAVLIILLTSREILPNQAKNELYTDRTYPGMFLMRTKAKILRKERKKKKGRKRVTVGEK